MATYSNVLAWRIPGTRGHGGLPSVGWHRDHTQTICFKEAFWYIYVYEGTHSLFENYVEKNEKIAP